MTNEERLRASLKTGPYFVNGQVKDYDIDGEGTCLTTALISYANDCRRAAKEYSELSAALLDEAARADAAATAAEYAIQPTPSPEVER